MACATATAGYTVRPTERGAYGFGVTHLYAASPLGLLLRRSREAAKYCTEKLGWKKIECCRDGTMRPIEDIQEEILGLI